MSHPFAGHSQNAVGKRRVKSLMRANGGEVAAKPVAKKARGGRLAKAAGGGVELGAKVDGKKAGGRLDRKARGGVIRRKGGGSTVGSNSVSDPDVMKKDRYLGLNSDAIGPKSETGRRMQYDLWNSGSETKKRRGGPIEKQLGGSIGRKLTPSKHKPHVRINIINNNARPKPKLVPVPVPGGMGPGMAPGMPSPPSAPGGLPAPMQLGGGVRPVPSGPTNPRAVAALAARRPMPPQAGGGMRPMGPTNPQAMAALAARPALPAQAQGMRPFQRGGATDNYNDTFGFLRNPNGTSFGPGPIGTYGGVMPPRPQQGGGLPPQALAALQGLPEQAQGPVGRGGFQRGGVVKKANGGYIGGVGTKANLKQWANYAKKAGGGSIQKGTMAKMDAGQGSGEGRLEQAHRRKGR